MLFTTISELKDFGYPNKHVAWDSLKFAIEYAEDKYIKPILGNPQYDALVAAYTNNTLTPQETTLLRLARKLLFNAAMYEALPHLNIWISEIGIQQNQSKEGTSHPASQAAYNEARASYSSKTTECAEALSVFLQENQNDYPAWQNSSAFSRYNNLLIRDNVELSLYLSGYFSPRFYVALQPFIKTAMLTWIKAVVMDAQIDALQLALSSNTLTPSDQLLLDKVRRALAWGAFSDGIPLLSVRVDGASIYIAMIDDALHRKAVIQSEQYRILLRTSEAKARTFQADLKAHIASTSTTSTTSNSCFYHNSGGGAFVV